MLGLDLEFSGRSDGMKPFQQAYDLELDRPQIRQMDPGLVYNAVRDGFVDAGLVYTTDGRVKGFDLKVLKDDKGFFPSYAVTPVVRKDTLEANPGLEETLNTLSGLLNNDVIMTLNAKSILTIRRHSRWRKTSCVRKVCCKERLWIRFTT